MRGSEGLGLPTIFAAAVVMEYEIRSLSQGCGFSFINEFYKYKMKCRN
jgi:hypothetical protein